MSFVCFELASELVRRPARRGAIPTGLTFEPKTRPSQRAPHQPREGDQGVGEEGAIEV